MQKKLFFLAVLLIILTAAVAYSQNKGLDFIKKWFKFQQQDALAEWETKIFKGKTSYTIEQEGQQGYVRAVSQDAGSGLFYKIRFDVNEYPMLSWRWKVAKFPDKSGVKDQAAAAADDFAARIYVVFPSGSFLTSKCIEYIWDEYLPEGTVITSPYSKNIKLIVAHTGQASKDDWIVEERNLYDDYKQAYGYPPRLRVGAVAFMTDTDSLSETAEASYDEIKVGYK